MLMFLLAELNNQVAILTFHTASYQELDFHLPNAGQLLTVRQNLVFFVPLRFIFLPD